MKVYKLTSTATGTWMGQPYPHAVTPSYRMTEDSAYVFETLREAMAFVRAEKKRVKGWTREMEAEFLEKNNPDGLEKRMTIIPEHVRQFIATAKLVECKVIYEHTGVEVTDFGPQKRK